LIATARCLQSAITDNRAATYTLLGDFCCLGGAVAQDLDMRSPTSAFSSLLFGRYLKRQNNSAR
jgi:hypothetical protein